MVENAHKRSWSPGSGRTSDNTMNRGYCKNSVSKNIPGQQTVALMACENLGCRNQGFVVIFRHSVEEIQESVTGYQEVRAKPMTPAAEP